LGVRVELLDWHQRTTLGKVLPAAPHGLCLREVDQLKENAPEWGVFALITSTMKFS
jgi:hypothetical protein